MTTDGLLIPEFDEESHTYKVDGKPAPSVTQILHACGIGVNPFWTEEGREFGKAVHAAIHYHAEGDLDFDALDDTVKPRLDAYINFRTEMDFSPELVEQPLYSRAPRYAGTPDQVQLGRAVVDFKTGSIAPETALQLAAYDMLLPNPYIHERWAVHLKDDGTYSLKVFTKQNLQADFAVFQSALNIYNWGERNDNKHQ